MKPLYIFDLDGTLADCSHRLHFIADKKNQRWPEFYAACEADQPIRTVMEVFAHLRASGAECWIFSGRSDEVREVTRLWITAHGLMSWHESQTALVMRYASDTRPDDVVKQEMLDRMLIEDRGRLVAVFDDRDRVVAMWRRNGITCFQCAPGDF